MPSFETGMALLQPIVADFDKSDITVLENGSRFFSPLGKGSLSFLHKLFPGCNATDLKKIEKILGFKTSDDYRGFMSSTDGALLFDNTLIVYGLRHNMSRSLRLEDQTSISLENEVNLRRRIQRTSWLPIGSVSAATVTLLIEMQEGNYVRLGLDSFGYKEFSSFSMCLQVLMGVISNLSDSSGLKDNTGFELEREMLSLLTLM